ncbi:hypothetical protein RI367_002223 [Sorochytrium milnesiophthora]
MSSVVALPPAPAPAQAPASDVDTVEVVLPTPVPSPLMKTTAAAHVSASSMSSASSSSSSAKQQPQQQPSPPPHQSPSSSPSSSPVPSRITTRPYKMASSLSLRSPNQSPSSPSPTSSPIVGPSAQAWPKVPGYESAVLGQETFVQYPDAQPTDGDQVAPLRRQKSVFRRQPSTLRRQKKRDSVLPPGPDVIRPQVNAVVDYLQRELGLKRSAYTCAMFSYAFSGFAEAIEEQRAIMWVSQPLVVTDDVRHLVDADVLYDAPLANGSSPALDEVDPETLTETPPAPWAMQLEHLLPEHIESSFEVSIEVPNTNHYRTCHTCDGRGTSKCSACRGKSLVLCKECKSTGVAKNGAMCQGCEGIGCKRCETCRNSGKHVCTTCKGHGTLRLFLLLRAFWVRRQISLTDTNNYPLNVNAETSLDKVDASYTTSDISELDTLDSMTRSEVEAFTSLLRVQLLKDSLPTSHLRTFVYNIRVIPLFEVVYVKNRMFLAKRKLKYLVYGDSIKGVIKISKSVARKNTVSTMSDTESVVSAAPSQQ